MPRTELVRKLVSRFHVNVSERRELGGRVQRSEVVEAILAILNEVGFYPPYVRPWKPGQPAYEGTVLERLPSGGFRAHLQRISPLGLVTGIYLKDYTDGFVAVGELIDREFSNGFDGIPLTNS
jgi:hypothetical protein